MVDTKKLDALIDWYFAALPDDLISVVIADRDGLLMANRSNDEKLDAEAIGGLSSLVEPILKRISTEFKSTGFGCATFDTENFRLIITEAGKLAVLVTIIDLYSSFDELFPYSYIVAEKVARILDGRPVSPVIPNLKKGISTGITNKEGVIQQIEAPGNYVYKIVLGGDGGVGKTSLIQTFVTGNFQSDYKATIGTSIMKKECEFGDMQTVVRLMIWDLAGQGQFARVRQTYLKDAMGGFIVYDVTRPETFSNVEKWYKEFITGAGDQANLLLIANKTDLVDDRKVSTEDGQGLSDKLGIPYYETSALNKDVVEEAFRILAFQLVQENIKIK